MPNNLSTVPHSNKISIIENAREKISMILEKSLSPIFLYFFQKKVTALIEEDSKYIKIGNMNKEFIRIQTDHEKKNFIYTLVTFSNAGRQESREYIVASFEEKNLTLTEDIHKISAGTQSYNTAYIIQRLLEDGEENIQIDPSIHFNEVTFYILQKLCEEENTKIYINYTYGRGFNIYV